MGLVRMNPWSASGLVVVLLMLAACGGGIGIRAASRGGDQPPIPDESPA
jgi:hypothetical protein